MCMSCFESVETVEARLAARINHGQFKLPGQSSPTLSVCWSCKQGCRCCWRNYFGKKLDSDDKDEKGLVIAADQRAEQAMALIILESSPSHSVFGEESGSSNNNGSDFDWVLDPVDGTRSIIAGKTSFGILIALLYKGKPILGCIDQPILSVRWTRITSRTTTKNEEPVGIY